ncbi:MAG TPA: pseudouridine-5'-phosphate glycosidase [Anaerolineaceae bacterium]|jgi:pseudouridine-5'-phosphate glycosidase|nr:pseudouridine-5'-phosphate glycosidase [Anaerolineaceae bacterium]NMD27118.1 pseudouridine-5'-phosphate glycosidase [Chloroflexota bacterium]HOA21577.1 pseudouridine-5'-phosphate glycosidase [Anaerolineaceae bacterium]HOG77789.1 pseudouridine-5'-phosphate glycosidase [Anaerolineaceae bacterium]
MENKKSIFSLFRSAVKSDFVISNDVERAKRNGRQLVALESALITHGVPWPENLNIARALEQTVRDNGAYPATIAVQEGQLRVGLTSSQLETLAGARDARKCSLWDLSGALTHGGSAGTTVASTLYAAERAEIKVFATGGIGGVHRGGGHDISTDLLQLSRSQVVVVCSGAKAILDLPATLEVLETAGVPVIGYQTHDFPAFYSIESGLKTPLRADSPQEVADIANTHWKLGFRTSVLVVVPPPAESALPREQIEEVIAGALAQAEAEGVRGSAVTPYLLTKISELSGGESLRANLALLRNNAKVAAEIAVALPQEQTDWRYI